MKAPHWLIDILLVCWAGGGNIYDDRIPCATWKLEHERRPLRIQVLSIDDITISGPCKLQYSMDQININNDEDVPTTRSAIDPR